MPQQEFDKILKSLEGKKIVKQVSSVQVDGANYSEPEFYELFLPFQK